LFEDQFAARGVERIRRGTGADRESEGQSVHTTNRRDFAGDFARGEPVGGISVESKLGKVVQFVIVRVGGFEPVCSTSVNSKRVVGIAVGVGDPQPARISVLRRGERQAVK